MARTVNPSRVLLARIVAAPEDAEIEQFGVGDPEPADDGRHHRLADDAGR